MYTSQSGLERGGNKRGENLKVNKIFEKIIKKQLVIHLDKALSTFISAYRKWYGTWNACINSNTQRLEA